MKLRILAVALAASSLAACALDPVAAQRATAVAAGNNAVAPEQVKVSDIKNGSLVDPAFRWHASAPNGEFDCSAYEYDGVLAQTLCVKK